MGMHAQMNEFGLDVRVVGLVFGDSPEARETLDAALAIDPKAMCCAIFGKEEGDALGDWWLSKHESPLLILRDCGRSAESLALEVVKSRPHGPLAILTLPDPRARRRVWPFASASPLVESLASLRPDVQVHVYSPDWRRRLPRII